MKKVYELKHGLMVLAAAIVLLALCIAVSPAAAADDDAPPLLPMQIYGSAVDGNGNPLPSGTVITAVVDGITSTYVVNDAGKIGGTGTFGEKFLITGKTSGSTVVFSVNDVESPQTVAFKSGETVEQQDLAFAVVIGKKEGGASSPSSGSAGTKSTLATPSPTPVPTTEPMETQTPVAQPTISTMPIKPTEPTSTPLPIIGIAAGLFAACVLVRRKV